MAEDKVNSSLTIRPMKCQLSCLSRADGSCSLSLGKTTVYGAVFGPGDAHPSKRLVDRAFIEVSFKPKVAKPDSEQSSLIVKIQSLIQGICNSAVLTRQIPRTQISVVIQELHNAGGLTAASVNAACLALLDAGIPMNCTFGALTVTIDKKTSEVILDSELTAENESRAKMTFVLTKESEGNEIEMNGCVTEGIFKWQEFQKCLTVAKEAAIFIFDFYNESVMKKMSLEMS